MASVIFTRGTTLPDSAAKSDFHNLVDTLTATVSSIVNADISGSAAIAASKLDLSTVGQNIVMSSKAINFAQGSDIASATTTDIGAATGNFAKVTGTTTITGLGTVQAGTVRLIQFTGALLLTHNATSLILPTAANITTVANDRALFASLGSGNWICLFYQRADGTPLVISTAVLPNGTVVGRTPALLSSVATSATAIPDDDTVPQNTEGAQILTVTHTPLATTNRLLIECKFPVYCSSSSHSGIALFQDSTAGALAAAQAFQASNAGNIMTLTHEMAAGTTSATTFKVRIGPDVASGATLTINGQGGGRKYGGVSSSSIIVTELKA